MQRIIIALVATFLIFSCKSNFEKTLRSKDIEKKKELAFKYYEDEDYYKASDLFKALMQDVKGGKEIEKMFFYYAMCDFHLEDYGLAAYEFDRLIQKFPRGNYTEEAQFLVGKANYHSAPQYQLDQDYTLRAIESFQLFLDKYPKSEKRDEVNKMVDDLTYRLEKKSYLQAKLYYKMEDYQSASVALENVLFDFPDTRHHEEINFLAVESKFQLAERSIESKKIDRYKDAIKASKRFQEKYAESNYAKKAINIEKTSNEQLKRLKLELPQYYFQKGDYNEAIKLYRKLARREKKLEKKNDFTLKLFQVYHTKARELATEKRLDAYEELFTFLDEVKPAQKEFLEKTIGKEITSAKLGYEKQKSTSAYTLYKEGKYLFSSKAYDKLLEVEGIPNKDKHVYFLMLSSYKYAEKLEAKPKKVVLDSLVINYNLYGINWDESKSYGAKAKRLKGKTEKLLAEYPVVLVSSPLSNGDYKTAMSRGQRLAGQNISKENKEEIVYLLIAASVKHARKGKRFERFNRYEHAEKIYNQYANIIESDAWKAKLATQKKKIDKGITKYQIKEE